MTPVRCTVSTVLTLILTIGLAGFGRRAEAQDARPRSSSFDFGVFGGVFMPDEHHEFYDSSVTDQKELNAVNPDFGLHLGFYPAAFVGIEGEGSGSFSETDAGGTANLYSLRASLVLQIPWRVTPFILGGVGNTWLQSSDDTLGNDRDRVWHGGAGVKIFLSRTVALRLEGRIYYTNQERSMTDPTDDNGMVAHFGALGGVDWAIGGRSKVEDQDPDRDGFLATADRCPNEKGVPPDGCPAKDSDGDGLIDPADRCPTEPEKFNGQDDTDGCPDEVPDTDGDGVLGEDDKCVGEPEDKDGFQDDDGCPDLDNDKDGVADGSDACPDSSGPPENRGCPDGDRDRDKVVDRIDNCPDQAGRVEYQGCLTKQLVVITPSQLQLSQNVQFGSGKAGITRPSRQLLDNVAIVVIQHPEFKKVRIEGHTDDRGADAVNKALSQQRAQMVADYLVGRGVGADRLAVVGFGEERPLASNQTASGRRKNRRVEFNLEEVRPPGSTQPGKPPGQSTGTGKGPDKAPASAGEGNPASQTKAPGDKDQVPIKPIKPESGGGGQ